MKVNNNFISVIKKFDQLSNEELYQIIALRISIFIVEQDCPYQEMDGMDQVCTHLYFKEKESDKIIATCRISPPETIYTYPSIGRVAVSKEKRSSGLGKDLMNLAIDECRKAYPGKTIKIAAQQYLETFYTNLGFRKITEIYLWDGIPHIDMLLD